MSYHNDPLFQEQLLGEELLINVYMSCLHEDVPIQTRCM